MPILETLDMFGPLLHSEFNNYDAFKIAPRLNTVKLNCGSAIRKWTLPWSQLIKLNVTMSTLFDVSTLLRELLNVEELLLNFAGIEDHVTDLSLLEGFFVRLECILVLQVPFPMILSWIEAPMLQELRLGDPDNWFRIGLYSTKRRSYPYSPIGPFLPNSSTRS